MSEGPRSINEWVEAAHQNAREHGWWPLLDAKDAAVQAGTLTVATLSTDEVLAKIALMHSELSEALEEVREGRLDYYVHPEGDAEPTKLDPKRAKFAYAYGAKPEGAVVELADCVIRIFDLCGALGLDLEGAIEAKHAYNRTRPFRHGGKRA
jgi:hypothetical protein